MKFDIPSGARPQGRHIGTLPHDQFARAEIHRAQRFGFNTIMAVDYEKLRQAGYEPDQFQSIPPEVVQLLPQLPNAQVLQDDENSLV